MSLARTFIALSTSYLAVGLSGCAGSTESTPPPALSSSLSKKILSSFVLPPSRWSEEKKALHALNRLAYGPAPGDVERVVREGVAAWIRAQMAPASLPDSLAESKLSSLPTLRMSIATLQAEFPQPKAVAAKTGIAMDEPNAKDKLRDLISEKRPAVMERELVTAKLVRAVESSRQLQEILTDFWFNHFNVFLGKGEDRWMVGPYERDAIRPHVFGSFRQLLGATARHPAMLWYLDNWASTSRGINENYARELLELHTLGVGGGYSEEDVREVARCFTGWSIVRPRGGMRTSNAKVRAAQHEAGTFVYRDLAHDKGVKSVLGEVIPAGGGIEDGEKVLDLLAGQPATARFVAAKLCRKFVADAPPRALVEHVAATFQRTRGDLPSVYAAIFSSPEFWSDSAFASKTKTPLELVVSAVRAMGGTVREDSAPALAQQTARMGEPLYQCQPPTGYKETAAAWVSTGVLLNRVNFALALAAGRIPGVTGDPALLASGSPDPVRVAALALGSPDFQKR